MADDKTERYELSRLGAAPTKNSGRGLTQKGDGILSDKNGTPTFTVDVKEYAKSYGLSITNLGKITSDAATNGLTWPLLFVVLGAGDNNTRWVVIPESAFLELWDAYNERV